MQQSQAECAATLLLVTPPINLPASSPAVQKRDRGILDCPSQYVPSGSCAVSDHVRSQAWTCLFTWVFGPLHRSVFHNDTGLWKQLENRGMREKCRMSLATLAEAEWERTSVWPCSAVSQRFPRWPRQFQYLLPSIIHVRWSSLKGYWHWDQLLNSVGSVLTSFLRSLKTKFCCMKWSLKLNMFETANICFYFPFLLIFLLFLLFLLYCFASLFSQFIWVPAIE